MRPFDRLIARYWVERTWPLFGFAVFTAVMLHPQLQRMDSVPDLGDPLFSIWRFGWVYRQVLGDPRSLWDANIFHPEPLTFAYSDSMLVPSLAAVPLLATGIHPVVTYNVLLVACFVLAAIAAYRLGLELTGSRPAAFVCGLVFGFYPFRFEHYSHLELQVSFWMPLALLALHRFASTARLGWAVAAALLAVAQLYSSMYLGLFFFCYASIVGVWLAIRNRSKWRELAPGALVAGAMVVVCAIPLARPYSANREVSRGRSAEEVRYYSAERLDYLRAQRRSSMWSHRTVPGRQEERALFPGVTAPVLAIAGLTGSAGTVPLVYLASLAFAYEASHGPNGIVFEPTARAVPPFRSIRVPARFSMLVGLSLAVLAAFGVQRLLRTASSRKVALVVGSLAIALAVDLRSDLRLEPVWNLPPGIYGSLPDGAVVAELPAAGESDQFSSIPYEYFSVWHGHAMVNGYSGYTPASYSAVEDALQNFPEPAAVERLKRQGATHVTVNCPLFRRAGYASRCGRLLEAIDRTPGIDLVARTRWDGDDVVLYRLR